MFHVGQMVAYIGVQPGEPRARINKVVRPLGLRAPEQGMVYTVRGFAPDWYFYGPSIYLEEIVNAPGFYARWEGDTIGGTYEVAWPIVRFRPVKTTSIEIFRKLVAPTKEHA